MIPSGQHDLAVAAKQHCRLRARSLGDLAKKLLGKEADKEGGARMGRWGDWPLQEHQATYAAWDACISLDLYLSGPEGMRQPVDPPKRPRGEGGEDGEDAPEPPPAKKKAAAGASAANANFFIAMRNKSLVPPMRGKKAYPQGPADCLKGYAFIISGVLDSWERAECQAYVQKVWI